MKIEVQLHTTLQKQTTEGLQRCIDLELPEGSTIRDVMQALELELAPEHLLLVVEGKVVEEGYVLSEGERVSLIPAMSGG
jgi:sulfur carrier protein ThiS